VTDSHHILVWEVSTIVIPGQRLLEQCEWNFGDIQHPSAKEVAKHCVPACSARCIAKRIMGDEWNFQFMTG
jgi:hypothetical protein